MSLFFTTTDVKHPMQDVAPFLETGTKLGYGLKVYRGYATVQNTDTTYALINVDGSSATDYVTLPLNCAIIGASIKRTGTNALTNITSFTLGMSLRTNYPTLVAGSNYCSAILLAAVDPGASANAGSGVCNGAFGGVIEVNRQTSTTTGWLPVLRAVSGTNSANASRVTVTMLVMETKPGM